MIQLLFKLDYWPVYNNYEAASDGVTRYQGGILGAIQLLELEGETNRSQVSVIHIFISGF